MEFNNLKWCNNIFDRPYIEVKSLLNDVAVLFLHRFHQSSVPIVDNSWHQLLQILLYLFWSMELVLIMNDLEHYIDISGANEDQITITMGWRVLTIHAPLQDRAIQELTVTDYGSSDESRILWDLRAKFTFRTQWSRDLTWVYLRVSLNKELYWGNRGYVDFVERWNGKSDKWKGRKEEEGLGKGRRMADEAKAGRKKNCNAMDEVRRIEYDEEQLVKPKDIRVFLYRKIRS